jgi:tryptophan-rich sensory protein
MQHFIVRILIFAVLNFGALGLGTYFMGGGPSSGWYQNLNKAPWTPPGWVFGVAWTTIMICFSVYMAELWENSNRINIVITMFAIQWALNVMWNPSFFKYQQVLLGLIIIILLTAIVAKLFFSNLSLLGYKSIWLLPYLLWLFIATSLNAYIFIKN